ncbi:acylphosphatase [Aeromonas sp. RU39B]|jgi:acylphosphatase|uniref:acylphosphatase n=1 Tax=Aeromonas sp. RU39B TaxID=1907416 RepID=UPI0009542F95|nr:acylphosphatase [Aeromonas sp. RU39B]SIQ76031.1 acylphosphatase [Aeromonas sp. RU39B]
MGEQSFVVRIYGVVQGVGFRYFTREQALRLKLRGHAYNLPDGSVEVWIAGPREQVQSMLSWLERGPRTAQVSRIEIMASDEFPPSGFHTN